MLQRMISFLLISLLAMACNKDSDDSKKSKGGKEQGQEQGQEQNQQDSNNNSEKPIVVTNPEQENGLLTRHKWCFEFSTIENQTIQDKREFFENGEETSTYYLLDAETKRKEMLRQEHGKWQIAGENLIVLENEQSTSYKFRLQPHSPESQGPLLHLGLKREEMHIYQPCL